MNPVINTHIGTFFTASLLSLFVFSCQRVTAQEATITVDAAKVENRVSPLLYGSCIEDVNHEIYGGLYDQRLFGESFEEPPLPPTFVGWTTLGGTWRSEKNGVAVASNAGAKLVRQMPACADGTVEADIFFSSKNGENAGLLVRVSDAGIGADRFNGYEISLSPNRQRLLLGKHRQDFRSLQEVAAPVAVNQWNHLRIEMQGARLRIYVNKSSAPLIDFTDMDRPLLSGTIGVRTWNTDAAFQNVSIETGQKSVALPFRAIPSLAVSGQWDAVRGGTAPATFLHDTVNPYNGGRAQMLYRGAGTGTVGIANHGLNRWGIATKKGQALGGRVYLRGRDLQGPVTVALQSADGTRTYARQTIASVGADWARYSLSLTPNTDDPTARFAIWIDKPGTLWADQVTLSGTGKAQFQGKPLRADIATKLQEQGLTFLRYGGTMVNAPEYRWKKMIGDRDRRPPYRGHWYPYSTNAFGIEEFVAFCEGAGFEPAFAINIEETAEDAADLVEYLNGPVTSTWGRRRAQNGHPKPYGVRYIEIGNEEVLFEGDNAAQYDHYIERFQALYEAMHARDPKIQFINAAWWRPESPNMARVFQALNGKAAYWDLHPWADDPRSGKAVDESLTQMRTLFRQWDPNTTMKAVIFEENGNLHNQQRALGHATVLNAVRRHGDFVLTSCPANALQPWLQNDNGWDQGQIFFTPSQVWGMPPFFAQQMAACNHQPLRIASSVVGDLDVTATRSEDGKTLVLHVVNVGANGFTATLKVDGFTPTEANASVEQLAAPLSATNTPKTPNQIQPQRSLWEHRLASGLAQYTFPLHSFTILRFSGKTGVDP